MMQSKVARGLVLLLIGSVLLTACGKPAGGGQPASGKGGFDPNGKLVAVTTADPTFNPWSPTAFAESNVINELLFAGLTRWDSDFKPEPDLATDWAPAADGLSWTFHLRQGVTWHDGQPFTADDVVFTFNNIVLNKKLAANGASSYGVVDHVEAVDPHTVKFVLKKPFASLPSYLAYYAGILPKHIFQGVEDPWKLTDFNKKNPIGTGPFKIGQYQPGSYVTLVANDNYWGGKPKLRSVTFKIVPDANAQVAQMLSGDVDVIGLADPAVLERFQNNPNVQVVTQTQNIWYWVALNQTDPRFQDVRVRQALLMAIDRPAIIKSVLKGYGQIATGPIPTVQKAYYDPNVQQYPYDVQQAKDLLKQAGWAPGPDGVLQKDGKPFTIDMPTGQYGQLVPMTLLVQQYWQAVGLKVNLKTEDWNSWIKQVVVNRDYQAALAWWSTPTDPDVYPYHASENAGKGYNIPNFKDPALDQILQAGREAKTQEDRVKIYNQAQELAAKELPYLYLWYPQTIIIRSRKIGGMMDNGQNAAFAHGADLFVKN